MHACGNALIVLDFDDALAVQLSGFDKPDHYKLHTADAWSLVKPIASLALIGVVVICV